jgi:hypothetical protein
LGFDLRDGAPADVQAVQLALGGKCLLGQGKLVSPLLDLFANNVGGFSGSGHVYEFGLDNTGRRN